MKLHTLTDHEAPFPSLSNKFSDDLVINLMLSLQGQLFTFKWKMVVWMVRIREAVRREFGSAARRVDVPGQWKGARYGISRGRPMQGSACKSWSSFVRLSRMS